MKLKHRTLTAGTVILIIAASVLTYRVQVLAHCDTMDGPVIRDARKALNSARVTPTLKWVTEEQGPEIERVFNQALSVRGQSSNSKAVADRLFFETLVRLHRASEGEPFTGVKPAGTDLGPAVRLGDRALESGKLDELVKAITAEVGNGIRRRFTDAYEKRRHSDESVSAGREFVAAYVEFMHYIEGIHSAASGKVGSHDEHAKSTEHKQ